MYPQQQSQQEHADRTAEPPCLLHQSCCHRHVLTPKMNREDVNRQSHVLAALVSLQPRQQNVYST
jgi:hypothetical protein